MKADRDPGGGENKDKKKELELKMRDLEISNRAKDQVIEQYQTERKDMLEVITGVSQKVGELETELRLLQEPKGEVGDRKEGGE